MEKKETIKLSVRALVEFILRCGDLDSARTGAPDREAMQLGAKVHRKIQKSMGEDYQPEVTLRYEKEYDEYRLRLEGRADGIVAGEDGVLIDEIKGTNRLLEQMDGVDPLHEAVFVVKQLADLEPDFCILIGIERRNAGFGGTKRFGGQSGFFHGVQLFMIRHHNLRPV